MTLLDVAVAILGGALAASAGYLVVLVVAALFYRDSSSGGGQADSRTVVALIPAHDEETTIAACVHSLLDQTYPSDRFEVVVIADNCTDETAAAAADAGATVMVRKDPDARGKGQALRWAFEQILARESPPDAVAIVDADSRADPNLLTVLMSRLAGGIEAVQGESLLWTDGSREQDLRAAAFLLVNRAKPSGRAVLGLATSLAGNGMLFSRRVLIDHPWRAFSSAEDLEYGLALRLAGVKPAFARGAIVWSPTAPNRKAAEVQQLRWEGGKLHLARTHIPRLLSVAARQRRASLVEAAADLAVPPLGYLAAAALALLAVATPLAALGFLSWWPLLPAAATLALIALYVLVGLRAAEAPAASYRALAYAPVFVVRKVAQGHRLRGFRPDSWVRTERR